MDIRRRRNTLALILIVALGALLRFHAIGTKTVWLDEAFSIWVANHGVVDGWRWLIRIDQHPPLYYTLLSLWQRLFGDLQGSVRALSALCSTLAIPFLYLATKRITRDAIAGLIAALILAVSPFHVRFAQEARMYALLTLLAAVAIYCVVRYLDGAGTRRLSWRDYLFPRRWMRLGDVAAAVGLSLAQAGVMWTHNTAAVFFPLALNLAVVAVYAYRRGRGRVVAVRAINADRFPRNWLWIQGVALLLWLPWAIPFAIQARKVDAEFWIASPTLATIAGTVKNLSFAHLPGWAPAPALLIAYGLLALGGIYALRRRPGWALLLLSLAGTPFVASLLVSLRRPIFYDRTLIWITLPYFMFMAIGLRGLMAGPVLASGGVSAQPSARWLRRSLAAVALAGVLGVSATALHNYYTWFEKEEWADAAAYVAASMEPGEMILFNATWVQIPFEYYFRHAGIEAELRGAPVDLFDRGVLEPKMTEDDVAHLRQLTAEEERVWLVYSHDWYTDPEQIVPRALAQTMRQVDRRRFQGLQVMEFVR